MSPRSGEFSANFVQDDCLLHQQLQRMFNHDFCEDENNDDLALSIEDKQFMKLMDESRSCLEVVVRVGCCRW